MKNKIERIKSLILTIFVLNLSFSLSADVLEGLKPVVLSPEERQQLKEYAETSRVFLKEALRNAEGKSRDTQLRIYKQSIREVVSSSYGKSRHSELLMRFILNQALRLTDGDPSQGVRGVLTKTYNPDVVMLIYRDSIKLAVEYAEKDLKFLEDREFLLPYNDMAYERLKLVYQWSHKIMDSSLKAKFLKTGLRDWHTTVAQPTNQKREQFSYFILKVEGVLKEADTYTDAAKRERFLLGEARWLLKEGERRLQEIQEAEERGLQEVQEAEDRRLRKIQEVKEAEERRLQEIREAEDRRLRKIQEAEERRLQEIREAEDRRLRKIQEAEERRLQEIREAEDRRLRKIQEAKEAEERRLIEQKFKQQMTIAKEKYQCKKNSDTGDYHITLKNNEESNIKSNVNGFFNKKYCEEKMISVYNHLTCFHNGVNYQPYNIETNNFIGRYKYSGSKSNCMKAVQESSTHLVCHWDGGGYKAYLTNHFYKKDKSSARKGSLGGKGHGESKLKNCLKVTRKATKTHACNWENSSDDGYYIYNLITNEKVGNGRYKYNSLNDCIEDLWK